MLGVFEHHEDTFRLEDYFHEMDERAVRELSAEGHFADGRLRDAGVLKVGAFFVGFEFFDSEGIDGAMGQRMHGSGSGRG